MEGPKPKNTDLATSRLPKLGQTTAAGPQYSRLHPSISACSGIPIPGYVRFSQLMVQSSAPAELLAYLIRWRHAFIDAVLTVDFELSERYDTTTANFWRFIWRLTADGIHSGGDSSSSSPAATDSIVWFREFCTRNLEVIPDDFFRLPFVRRYSVVRMLCVRKFTLACACVPGAIDWLFGDDCARATAAGGHANGTGGAGRRIRGGAQDGRDHRRCCHRRRHLEIVIGMFGNASDALKLVNASKKEVCALYLSVGVRGMGAIYRTKTGVFAFHTNVQNEWCFFVYKIFNKLVATNPITYQQLNFIGTSFPFSLIYVRSTYIIRSYLLFQKFCARFK